MKTTRRGALVVLIGSSLALVTETVAFSGAGTDRSLTVSAVEDSDSLVQLTGTDEFEVGTVLETGGTYDTPHDLVIGNVLENRPVEFTIGAERTGHEAGPTRFSFDGEDERTFTLDGLGAAKRLEIDHDEHGDVTEVVIITAETEGVVTAELAREITLRSDGEHVTGVRFTGARGNAKIATADGVEELTVTYWELIDGELHEETITVTDVAGPEVNLQSRVTGTQFAAVYVHEDDTTHVHQNLEVDDGHWSIEGGQGSNEPTHRVCDGFVPPDANVGCWES